jgi:hypothetical protein
MEEEKKAIEINLKGCIRHNGEIFIPLSEIINLCQRFAYLLGKDLAKVLSSSSASLQIPEINEVKNEISKETPKQD